MAPPSGFAWPRKTKGAVSFTFDDARPSQLDRGIPVFDASGFKATFYVSPGPLVTAAERWRAAAAGGHELGNHTFSHPCSGNFDWSRENALEDYTHPRIEQDIRHADQVIEKSAGVQTRTFAYPCGQSSIGRGVLLESYIPLIAKRYVAGRGYLSEHLNDAARCDLAHLASTRSDRCSLLELEGWISRALTEGSWLIFTGHDVNEDNGYHTTRERTLSQLLQDLAERREEVWVAPVAEVAAWIKEHREALPGETAPEKR